MKEIIMTAAQIAEAVNGKVKGNGEQTVKSVNSLKLAANDEVSFLSNVKYVNQLTASKAGIVLISDQWDYEPAENQTFILCNNPDKAFTRLCGIFAPDPVNWGSGIHPTAVIHPTATVGEGTVVGANVVIEEGAKIGKNTILAAGVYVGHFAEIGDDCLIYPNVSIMRYCQLANKIIIHSGTTIGSDGFGFTPTFTGLVKVPQNGIVRIESNVEIGANCTVDRARFGRTWIKKGVKIDNLVQVAHNVVVGECSVLIAQSGVAGSTEIGRGVTVSAQAGINGHITLGDGSTVAGASAVQRNLPPGVMVLGTPAETQKEFVERHLLPRKVQRMADRIRELEEKLAALEEKLAK